MSYTKNALCFPADDLGMWAVGFVASFISAFLCVRWLLRYISSHDFTVFAWYRIAFGLVVLVTYYSGVGELVSELALFPRQAETRQPLSTLR